MINLYQYLVEKLVIDKDTKDLSKEEQVEILNSRLDTIKDILKEKNIPVTGKVYSGFSPESTWLRLSFLKPEDEPSIAANGMYIIFKINLYTKIIEYDQSGHIYLTKEDQQKSYLAMTGLKKIFKFKGKPFFRKTKCKTFEDITKKLIDFYDTTKKILDEVTEGYPYKNMKINIYV